ncbi:lipopolysaccharide transport periplasmic protein LptA [Alteromonas sp. W364]|uniref:lipopolysaccharide transport periplasmic protein LptA n=1 Tax=Alteromonas sp. W364 TaxID=3075610 RepID=UPI002884A54B|nr:lipopolysaccharide transport periplasmic protein LptA [Alteromonas sp. W364]MDT0629019.1 lipopolysaccharide transport periplasmic protein LptA [Alteromonas sp. W364]
MLKLNTYLLASCLTLGLAFSSTAQEIIQKSDFEQPIRLESENTFADSKEKVLFYEGNVKITQGSLKISADKMEVIGTNGAGREIFIATGKPASYIQQLADGSMVEARANEIKYIKADRTISLKGNAQLLQNAFTIKGDSIIFDMQKEQVLANTNEKSNTPTVTIFSPDTIQKTKDTLKNKAEDADKKQEDDQ